MITLRFPDGSSIKASSPSVVLRTWRKRQWHETDAQGWREELAKRAYIWSNAEIDTGATPTEFLNQLESAGLLKIERS